jgi:hypothetical protein
MTTEYIVQIEEVRNVVTVDQQDPSIIYVSTVGTQGVSGNTIISGTGEPSLAVGNVSDIYIDTVTGYFWGPKTDSGWPLTPFYQPSNTRRFIFDQPSPSDTWNITHSLGGRPSVTVVDSASTMVIGEVNYLSDTDIQLVFSAPFSGKAYLT